MEKKLKNTFKANLSTLVRVMGYSPTYKSRYSGVKARYWDFLSDLVRIRDFIAWGVCVTCGERFNHWKDSQAGHFLAAGNCGFSLLFDPKNIHGECGGCNAFNKNHQITYRENLIKRYGVEYVLDLENRYKKSHFGGQTTKEWTKLEYEANLLDVAKQLGEVIKTLP